MELHLFIILFFTGLLPLAQSIYRKYYLIQQAKTWSDAQAYCRSTYTDLATIETANDVVNIQNEAQKYQLSSKAWIGLWNDINSWRWSFGNEPLNWSHWALGPEPGNNGGHEECAATNQWNWFDIPCSVQMPFLCFDEDQTSPSERYIFYSNQKTWIEAQAFCRASHTDLACPTNETQNSVMFQYLASNASSANTWFGLFRDSWKWSDQTNFSTVTWMPGQPDNAVGNENCGYVYNGQVGDASCSITRSFFCYQVMYPVIKQIVRVKVQSDQDVNDPALKAAILQQINQKLNDHRMENVTVGWREGPGRVVFHKMKEDNTTTAQNQTGEICKVYTFN